MATEEELNFDTDNVAVIEDGNKALRDPSSIEAFVIERFTRAEDARKTDEDRWTKAYRNYRGLYGSDVQFTEAEKSRVFIKVTKTKTLAAYGQIIDVLFGNNTFPLSVNPTRLPDGVAEAVHINTDPASEQAMDQLRGVTEDKASQPYLFGPDTKLKAGETIADLQERLGPLKEKLEPVSDKILE